MVTYRYHSLLWVNFLVCCDWFLHRNVAFHYTINEWKLVMSQISKTINSVSKLPDFLWLVSQQKCCISLYINEWKLVKSQIPKSINSDTILFSWSRSNKSWYCQCGNRYLRLLYFKWFKWKWKLVKSQISKITNSVMIFYFWI